jgi:3-oxoacyl-[acyl-carrier protein] reductase
VGKRPLVGRVALVTGAGRGIGRSIAGWFAEAGADVALAARTASEVERAASEIEANHGVLAMHVSVDVGDAAAVASLASRVEAEFGHIDIAVANAAILGPVGTVSDVDADRWLDTLRINVGGAFHMIRAVVPGMTARRSGRILTLSGAGIGGPRLPERLSAYVASKAAVVAFTEVVAKELPPGVTINAVAPGAVPTTFMHEVLDQGPEVAGDDLYQTVANTPHADDSALKELVLYLASSDSEWLSGCCLSARWDRPDTLRKLRDAVPTSSRLRLRRIDEDLFGELRRANH